MNCIVCEGTKRETIEVRNVGEGTVNFVEMDCIPCGGTGVMSIEQILDRYEEFNKWCDCGNPSGEVDFYDDGEHADCEKHHYHCVDCGKITQVG